MKLSTKGKYAVTAMMDLAVHHRAGPMSLVDISKNQDISLSYLEQIFSKLRRSGLVEGVRGPGGGYRLAKQTDQISVADIIMAVDVPEASSDNTPCLDTEDDNCLARKLWEDLNVQLYSFLDAMTLSDFVPQPSIHHLRMPKDTESSYINNMFLPVARAS